MKSIGFTKYHGTSNDFIIIDQESSLTFDLYDIELIRNMCDRRTGIGADGLMLILPTNREDVDFEMKYFNADGKPSSMCGNGGRCIVKEAAKRSLFFQRTRFLFNQDIYLAQFDPSRNWVSLKMQDIEDVKLYSEDYVLDTGSPHYVRFCSVLGVDVFEEGKAIRYSEPFKREGINVNFVEHKHNALHVLTYERGVEDETYSCGTGVVASTIAWAVKEHMKDGIYSIDIHTKGGKLEVSFEKKEDRFTHIFLKGPAIEVFKGRYNAC